MENSDEGQPLLGDERRMTPLKKRQLAIILLVKLADATAYMQVYPYVNQMVEELHIARNKASIGYASGLVLSSISVAQIFTNFMWGRISDRIGRKPALLFGLSGYALSALLFGTSKSFQQMLLARLSMGILSGNVPIIYSVLSDMTDETNRARVIPLNEVTWQIGAFLGAFIGGMLSHPAERYPKLFDHSVLLKDWPYLLPCLASCILTILAFLCTLLLFEETLPRIVAARKTMSLVQEEDGIEESALVAELSSPAPLPTTMELLSDPSRRRIIASGFFLAFFAIGFDPLFALWNYTPVALGGLGREPYEIGLLLSTAAVVGMLLNGFVFHRLEQRFGSLTLFVTGISLWSINFAAMPIISAIVRTSGVSSDFAGSTRVSGLWFATLGLLLVEKMASLAYPAYILIVRAAAPGSGSVGAVFGLAQTAGSLGKCISPALMSSLFAFSIEKQVLGGQFVWVVLLGITYLARQFAASIR
ncbi:hypothetical protein M407DRAFT_78253 [Tulasnella calospora MUT 4182]|uniref:Major facilitator superfamily (MFS) profile domain-containing protein n=1 Tax=Tulasnella calospora MUT 4182 TaxID=1051891 RepID=A0A0C3QCV5_9AGAM|nr:hypothetical protein M407DRAFT_78253 [Tulasnella calospora MUT 4182]